MCSNDHQVRVFLFDHPWVDKDYEDRERDNISLPSRRFSHQRGADDDEAIGRKGDNRSLRASFLEKLAVAERQSKTAPNARPLELMILEIICFEWLKVTNAFKNLDMTPQLSLDTFDEYSNYSGSGLPTRMCFLRENMEMLKHCRETVSQNPSFREDVAFGGPELTPAVKIAVEEVQDVLENLIARQQDHIQTCVTQLTAKTDLAAVKESQKAIQQAQGMRYVEKLSSD